VILVIALVFASDLSHKAKNYVKHFINYGGVMTAAFSWIPFLRCDLKKFSISCELTKEVTNKCSNNLIRFQFRTASTILSPISKLIGLKSKLRGRENLNKNQTCVIVVKLSGYFG
jgi:hypothetical protein